MLDVSYTALYGNLVTSKNKGTSPLNLVPNWELSHGRRQEFLSRAGSKNSMGLGGRGTPIMLTK